MVPAQFVARAVTVPADALTQAHNYHNEVVSCQRCEIVICHVLSLPLVKTAARGAFRIGDWSSVPPRSCERQGLGDSGGSPDRSLRARLGIERRDLSRSEKPSSICTHGLRLGAMVHPIVTIHIGLFGHRGSRDPAPAIDANKELPLGCVTLAVRIDSI